MSTPLPFVRPSFAARSAAMSRIAEGVRLIAMGVQELADAQDGPAEHGPELSLEQALSFFPGRSRRWLLDRTKGLPFRRDVTQRIKQFEARSFHRWREGL